MPAAVTRRPTAAAHLDRALGAPLDERLAGSFRASVDADRQERFPHELCQEALDWGMAEHLIPQEQGGSLRSLEECFALSRTLSRRDLTATVALGANLLAGLPVWLAGTAEQKDTLAGLLRGGRFLSFALSEEEHGSDVLETGVTARRTASGWRVDGTKWSINNAGHASGATVTARTGDGVRGLTLFLLTRDRAGAGQWAPLPKLRTHGLRGSAFGGIAFSELEARDADVVGRPGQGLEILLHTLQVTRVLVASFALGALDTCLAAAGSFARSRRLYDAPIAELEPVARRLSDAYAELQVGEALAQAACRVAQVRPEQLPLMSACVKYLVPRLANDSIESLSVVLGARSYLAGGLWHGIVEKMRRDCAVTALFDGSAPVNLGVIADHLPALAHARACDEVDDLPAAVFAASADDLPWLDDDDLELVTASDAVHPGLAATREALRRDGHPVAHRGELLDLVVWCEAETARVDDEVRRSAGSAAWRRGGAAYDLAARYSHLHAAAACASRWLARREESTDPFVTSGAWLVLCLRRLVGRLRPGPAPVDDVDRAALARLGETPGPEQWSDHDALREDGGRGT
ncbi:acyl-CoA dehydrogenase [Cellulomonas chitinilytica]|uniref:Acyl-CoA dehydrogenase n=1 Tax=Cellulomonas chitinilytica TaxID=398759 RepID=A0A919P2N5_9CELL|nr:acyl-CoA dehydrogenase family protein [Cellulomonas chitinilytica]GIG21120.1 acyl-CoA dehydrogenase [Cellulomonas chitinilytica]